MDKKLFLHQHSLPVQEATDGLARSAEDSIEYGIDYLVECIHCGDQAEQRFQYQKNYSKHVKRVHEELYNERKNNRK
jgi:Zn ribbon nucleic-acid-binding protein